MLRGSLIALICIMTASNAFAETKLLDRPMRRSAIQNECLDQHANDHQAYVACIREKKEARKAERQGESDPTPVRGIDQMRENMKNNPTSAK